MDKYNVYRSCEVGSWPVQQIWTSENVALHFVKQTKKTYPVLKATSENPLLLDTSPNRPNEADGTIQMVKNAPQM